MKTWEKEGWRELGGEGREKEMKEGRRVVSVGTRPSEKSDV